MLKIHMIGNLTKDPESRSVSTNGGTAQVISFTVAANHGFGDYKKTEFVRVSAWRNYGETCLKYLSKGSKVYISGTPTVNCYVNKDGNAAGNLEVQLEEIEFLSTKPAEAPVNNNETDEDIDDLL